MDFYVILGIERAATPAVIKRAYTRLSRRFHPGINPGDRAASALFERIWEAYETLSDPERRRQYDAADGRPAVHHRTNEAFEFAGFDFSFAARGTEAATFSELFSDVLHPTAPERGGPEHGADLHASLTIAFEQAIHGVERQVVVTRQVNCTACEGTGQIKRAEGRCPHCQATGKVRWARGHMVFSKACAACAGTGRQRQRCDVCAGHGRGARSDAVPVRVPPGAGDGTRLRVVERGHVGRRGGHNGDLYVDVHVQPHPTLRREGDDLFMVVPIAVHEAVLGARIDVPTLDGDLRITVRPGTQAGQRFRVAGRGAPAASGGRGDFVVEVQLVLPKAVDERSKELIREFGRLNGDDVRRDLRV